MRRSSGLLTAIAMTALVLAAPARAAGPPPPAPGPGLVPGYDDPPPAYAWEGRWQSREVTLRSARTGATLYGVLFAPRPLPTERMPAVVISPGSGGATQAMYHWAARDLAGHGYLAVSIDPQGVGRSDALGHPACAPAPPRPQSPSPCAGVPFQQADNYLDAIESGLDFLLSTANPWRALVDADAIGVAGHSLSARAASYAQGVDRRIRAVVAWDNLASDLHGDAGSASGGNAASSLVDGGLPGPPLPVRPRVPSLGEANDQPGTTAPTERNPDLKEPAFALWRSRHVPTMEVVFRGASHLDWSQTPISSSANEAKLRAFVWYTQAWFDRFLRGDRNATARLVATTVNGVPRTQLLSSQFRSGAYLDGIDCPDLSRC